MVPFDALTGLKAFVVANALSETRRAEGDHLAARAAVAETVGALSRLRHDDARAESDPHARGQRTGASRRSPATSSAASIATIRAGRASDLPPHLFAADYSDFEQEINQLRTHQGQSDVYVINDKGTILAPTFGGGANSLVTEMLGDAAIISSDFGGNPPYAKMKEVARICFKHWLKQSNVLFIIGGKSNNTDIFETLRAMADALREHFSEHGPTPLYVVLGRGGPNLVRGMARAERHLRLARPALPAVRIRLRHQ